MTSKQDSQSFLQTVYSGSIFLVMGWVADYFLQNTILIWMGVFMFFQIIWMKLIEELGLEKRLDKLNAWFEKQSKILFLLLLPYWLAIVAGRIFVSLAGPALITFGLYYLFS